MIVQMKRRVSFALPAVSGPPPGPSDYVWEGPLTITNQNYAQHVNNGVVSNRFFKNDSYSQQFGDAVIVQTSQPVTFQNCGFWSIRNGIGASGNSHNVQASNCRGWGMAVPSDKTRGKFLFSENGGKRIHVNNCYMKGFSGGAIVWDLQPYSVSGQQNAFVFKHNKAESLNGKQANNPTQQGGHVAQTARLYGVHGCLIQGNEYRGIVGVDFVEDVFSVYETQGLSTSPYVIEDNFIRGATGAPLNYPSTGGGILFGDQGNTLATVSAHIIVRNNYVLETSHYGIGAVRVNRAQVYNNIICSSGKDANGNLVTYANVGIYLQNDNDAEGSETAAGTYLHYDINFYGNEIGYMSNSPGNGSRKRNDRYFPGFDTYVNNGTYAARTLHKQLDNEGILYPGLEITKAHVDAQEARYMAAKTWAVGPTS